MIALASAAVIFLWLRPGADAPVAPVSVVSPPPLEEQLRKGHVGSPVAPEVDPADAAPAGPAVAPGALDQALRDPASFVRATEALTEAQRDARLTALAQEAGSRERVAALSLALRGLPDPRGALLADALERLAPNAHSR
jgi:hypothetical protein